MGTSGLRVMRRLIFDYLHRSPKVFNFRLLFEKVVFVRKFYDIVLSSVFDYG